MQWDVFVDHETIIYDIEAETQEEAERLALEQNGMRRTVDVCSVEAWLNQEEDDHE